MGTSVSKSDKVTAIEGTKSLQSTQKQCLQQSVSTSIIVEKERRRQKEQNEPETQMAITEAEKMLEIYRKEMKPTSEQKPVGKSEPYDKPIAEVVDKPLGYNTPMQKYKTSKQQDCGEYRPACPPKIDLNHDLDIVEAKALRQANSITCNTSDNDHTVQSSHTSEKHAVNDRKTHTLRTNDADARKPNAVSVYRNTDYIISTTNSEIVRFAAEERKDNAGAITDPMPGKQNNKMSPGMQVPNQKSTEQLKTGTIQDFYGSTKGQRPLITNNVSQHCPNLLNQRNADSNGTLKPLDKDSLNYERQKVRSELEKQGIVAPGCYADAVSQVILDELQEAGIILKDEKYTLSSGIPVRRPPPRLNQLPPLYKPRAKAEVAPFMELGRPAVSAKNTFSFVDYGRPLLSKADVQQQQIEDTLALKEIAADGVDREADFEAIRSVNREKERIDDINKLKLKLFELDTL